LSWESINGNFKILKPTIMSFMRAYKTTGNKLIIAVYLYDYLLVDFLEGLTGPV